MEWGVHLPHLGKMGTREGVMDYAKTADRLGVHSVWVSDHIAWPASVESSYPYSDDGAFPATHEIAWLEPLGTLLFVAGCTENVKLGQTVLILGYRPNIQTAKTLATLDVLSNGRSILGVGVGWMKEEFEVLGMPFDQRGKRANETLKLWENLFTEELPSFDGEFSAIPPIGFNPKPVQGHIPVWVGGDTEAAYKRTARFGDCFHAAFEPLDAVTAGYNRVRELAVEAGRGADDITLSLRIFLDPAATAEAYKSIQGSTEQMIERCNEFAAAGVDHLLLDPIVRGGVPGRIEQLEHFMTDIAPHVG